MYQTVSDVLCKRSFSEEERLDLAKSSRLGFGILGSLQLAHGIEGKSPLSVAGGLANFGLANMSHSAVKEYKKVIKSIEQSSQYKEIVARAIQMYGKK